MIMRRQYIYPTSDIQPMYPLTVLCDSGATEPRITGKVTGGDKSGDVADAF